LKLEDASIVARFGGEEFSAIMDGPLRIAAEKLNDIRKQIARQQMDVGDTNLDITISIGLSEPRDDVVIGPLLRRADEALYAAKKIGRNRVYFHDGQSPRLVGAPEVARG
jgi:diguanylate cyclase